MSIFPERHRRTKRFTGYWIAEHRGKKSRHFSFEEAEEAEANFKGQPLDSRHAPKAVTLREVPSLWKSDKDGLRSERRWRVCLTMLGKETPINTIRKLQLETLVSSLGESGRGPKTINRYLATVSRALRWAHEGDLIAGMPAIPWQREGEGRKVYLPTHLEYAFLEAVEGAGGPYARLGIYLLLITGMRSSELLTLSKEDIINDVIYLSNTKTGKPRSIPIPDGKEALRWVEGLIAPRKASKACGVGSTGIQQPTYRLLLKACHEASKRLGIAPPITPHALRHTVATRLTAAGVNALTVARLLGHSSLATTRGYAHHEVDTLREAVANLVSEKCREDRLDRRENIKPLQSNSARFGICSPLRSHSATRPSVRENK